MSVSPYVPICAACQHLRFNGTCEAFLMAPPRRSSSRCSITASRTPEMAGFGSKSGGAATYAGISPPTRYPSGSLRRSGRRAAERAFVSSVVAVTDDGIGVDPQIGDSPAEGVCPSVGLRRCQLGVARRLPAAGTPGEETIPQPDIRRLSCPWAARARPYRLPEPLRMTPVLTPDWPGNARHRI